ncbi:MAG: O-antigen ligase family protein [Roseburia sp.]|nr:O-antigen ligase family protein [Roseburia sp.]
MEFLREILSDQKHVKRNANIQILMATLAFILLVRVYPMGIPRTHEVSRQQAVSADARGELVGEAFTAQDKKLQTVYFTREHLDGIVLYLNCKVMLEQTVTETIWFRLYNDGFSCIYEEEYSCRRMEKDGYLRASVDMDVETDRAYYYEILVPEECVDYIELPVADRGALGQVENSTLYIDGIINDEVCLIADFDYSEPLSAGGILLRYALILAVTAALYALVMLGLYYYDRELSDYAGVIDRYARVAGSVLAGAGMVFLFLFCVVWNKFGGGLWDRLFFAVAVPAAGLWVMGALWLPFFYPKKPKTVQASVGRQFSFQWRNYIQTVSFGFLFYALCQYVNAQREYDHMKNTRWMLIFLAIAFLMTFSERQLLNRLNAIWLAAGTIGAILYCGGVTGDEQTQMLAKLTCGVVAAWGLLILNILLQIRVGRGSLALMRAAAAEHVPQVVYGALWVVFALFMWCYRFEKVWVFTAVLPFLAMFFLRMMPAAKSRFLKNFTDGILLSFGLVVLFSLHHRPYHYWTRYGALFHTVACTGMYMAVVLGAALGKLYGKLKDGGHMLRRCFYELSLAACAISFILLTVSRTAFLTMGITVVAIVGLAAVTYRKRPRRVLRELGMFAAAVLMCFPVVFSTVRSVPAIADDPIQYEIEREDSSHTVRKGDRIDSGLYMTVEHFFSVLLGRFGYEAPEEEEAFNGISVEEQGLLAYTGEDFAGMQMNRAADDPEGAAPEAGRDVSNGRFEIFRDYFKALELKGHPGMGLLNDTGEDHGHAHNSYLQVAYNFGMIAGMVFLSICALSLWSAARLVVTQGRQYGIFMVPFALVIVFGAVSLTEWAFHPCIPAGFCFLILQVLFLRQ